MYWFAQFLEEHRIADPQSAIRELNSRPVREALLRAAHDAATLPVTPVQGHALLAGDGVDLFDPNGNCPTPSCGVRRIERLFRHVWHYFDEIRFRDIVGAALRSGEWDPAKTEDRQWIVSRALLLLHIRAIGAESVISFESPGERGNSDESEQVVSPAERELVSRLVSEGRLEQFQIPGGSGDGLVHFALKHPLFSTDSLHSYPTASGKATSLSQMAAEEIASAIASRAVRDETLRLKNLREAAEERHASLGDTNKLHHWLLQNADTPSASDVAFSLELPILENVPVATLIALRRGEGELFRRFQTALRIAAGERLKAGPGTPEKVAGEIRDDIVEPELRRIRDVLRTSESTLVKKATVNLALGTLVTTCGLLAGALPAVALVAGAAALATGTISGAARHLDDQRDAQLSPMYFLWKAVEHAEE